MNMTTSPRIYVACLASYNNGVLHGAWIDADQSAEEIQAKVGTMLRASRYPNVLACPSCGSIDRGPKCAPCGRVRVPSAEEWAIHDFEGFAGIKLSESESFETVAALAELAVEHGEAFAAWYDNETRDEDEVDEWAEQFQDAFAGTFRTVEEWAEEYAEDTGMLAEVPESLRRYFDFDSWARDARLGGDIWTADTSEGIAVFWNH